MRKRFTLKDILPGIDQREKAKDISESLKKEITEFLYVHKNLLVVIADPDSDTVVVAHKEHLEAYRLIDGNGYSSNAVSDMLKYNKEEKGVKNSINSFLLLIDGAIHDIAKRLKGEGNDEKTVEINKK